ncbi:MAG: aspartate/glutamate racemase family protein [Betaproteobacteria bacterium]
MKIWHQSLTVLEDVPDYAALMAQHIRRVVRPDTEVVLHGLLPGTYPANYPGDDISFAFLFAMHSLQFPLQALNAERAGYDAFAVCTLPDPMLREVKTLVDIPVVGAGEVCFTGAAKLGRRFGMLVFIERMVVRYLEQIRDLGLAERCVGVVPVGFRFGDVLSAFHQPGPLIDRFRKAAQSLVDAGAEVIVPGEIPLNLLLAAEGVGHVGKAQLIDSLGLTLQATEAAVLQKTSGEKPEGWLHSKPSRARVEQVLGFYGLERFLER